MTDENGATEVIEPDVLEPNADPESDSAPKKDGRKREWSPERKEKHAASLREAWARRKEGKPPGQGRAASKVSLVSVSRQIGELIAAGGGLLSLKDPTCGAIIITNSERLGNAYGKLAVANPRLRRFFEGMIKSGVYGEAIIATLVVALPIMAHHNMVPPQVAAAIQGMFREEGDSSDGETVSTGPAS
jgi:hypothetical protein